MSGEKTTKIVLKNYDPTNSPQKTAEVTSVLEPKKSAHKVQKYSKNDLLLCTPPKENLQTLKMRTCFFQTKFLKKDVRKTKCTKTKFKKKKKNIFFQKRKSSRLRGNVFLFFQKKKTSKLSVFENGYF